MPVMILTLPRAEVYEQDRLAQANDPAAIQYMENLWAGVDEDLSCLLCDAVVERPVHSLMAARSLACRSRHRIPGRQRDTGAETTDPVALRSDLQPALRRDR